MAWPSHSRAIATVTVTAYAQATCSIPRGRNVMWIALPAEVLSMATTALPGLPISITTAGTTPGSASANGIAGRSARCHPVMMATHHARQITVPVTAINSTPTAIR